MENQISIAEISEYMSATDPAGNPLKFDLVVRGFSRQNKTGGKLSFYNGVQKPKPKGGKNSKSLFSKLLGSEKARKNPNHFENRTRNIELENGEIRKINLLFIIKFNGKNVIY